LPSQAVLPFHRRPRFGVARRRSFSPTLLAGATGSATFGASFPVSLVTGGFAVGLPPSWRPILSMIDSLINCENCRFRLLWPQADCCNPRVGSHHGIGPQSSWIGSPTGDLQTRLCANLGRGIPHQRLVCVGFRGEALHGSFAPLGPAGRSLPGLAMWRGVVISYVLFCWADGAGARGDWARVRRAGPEKKNF